MFCCLQGTNHHSILWRKSQWQGKECYPSFLVPSSGPHPSPEMPVLMMSWLSLLFSENVLGLVQVRSVGTNKSCNSNTIHFGKCVAWLIQLPLYSIPSKSNVGSTQFPKTPLNKINTGCYVKVHAYKYFFWGKHLYL